MQWFDQLLKGKKFSRLIVNISDSVVSYLEEGVVPDFKKLDPAKSRILFAGFYCILRLALRHKDLLENTFVAVLKDLSFSDQVLPLLFLTCFLVTIALVLFIYNRQICSNQFQCYRLTYNSVAL